MLKKVEVMRIPVLETMKNCELISLVKIEKSYQENIREFSMQNVQSWLSKDPANNHNYGPLDPKEIRHELSPFLEKLSFEVTHPARSQLELRALLSLSPETPSVVISRGIDYFKDFLFSLASSADGPGSFRTFAVSTIPDRAGNKVIYPSASLIEGQISKLFDFLSVTYERSPSLCAGVLLAGICNIHPFKDANGRISRMLYNWLMSEISPNTFYLPIYEISALSGGGFLIRLRQAHYHNNWTPLISFLEYVTDAFSSR
jgi:hypothetical protein